MVPNSLRKHAKFVQLNSVYLFSIECPRYSVSMAVVVWSFKKVSIMLGCVVLRWKYWYMSALSEMILITIATIHIVQFKWHYFIDLICFFLEWMSASRRTGIRVKHGVGWIECNIWLSMTNAVCTQWTLDLFIADTARCAFFLFLC